MHFKVSLEIDPEGEDEIRICARALNEDVLRLQRLIRDAESAREEIELHLGGNDYFVRLNEILFFESAGPKVAAHTGERMYYTDWKLYELEERLPRRFTRISKSCILNTGAVSSLRRDITGICEVFFANTIKKVYVSRSYYKSFRDVIRETRLEK